MTKNASSSNMPRFLVACLMVCLVGCLAKSDDARLSRLGSLEIQSSALVTDGIGIEPAARLDAQFAASLERALVARGYPVVTTGGEGVVRCSWSRAGATENAFGRSEAIVGLSFSVFDRSGTRLHSVRTLRPLPVTQWNEARLAAEITRLLRDFPEASPPAPTVR